MKQPSRWWPQFNQKKLFVQRLQMQMIERDGQLARVCESEQKRECGCHFGSGLHSVVNHMNVSGVHSILGENLALKLNVFY